MLQAMLTLPAIGGDGTALAASGLASLE